MSLNCMVRFVPLKIFVNLAMVVTWNDSLRCKLDVLFIEGISKLLRKNTAYFLIYF